MKRFLLILMGIGMLLGLSACNENNAEPPQNGTPNEEEPVNPPTQDEGIPTLTEDMARERLTGFKQDFLSLANEQNEQQEISSVQTKTEVKQYFRENLTVDYASRYTESNFTESEDGVYLIPRGGPVWLEEEEPFELEQITETEVKLIQEQKNALFGYVTLECSFQFQDGKWLLDNVEMEEVTVEEIAETVLDLLAAKDMAGLASYVHPDKGILFSPYGYIAEDALVFSQTEIEQFFSNDSEVFLWGVYDGSGFPIELTTEEYYEKFIYNQDFQHPDEVVVNEVKQRGNTMNNIKEVFPNSVFVEYHRYGTEEYSGMDWSSLQLVLEQNEFGEWKLVAVVHDQWTI
ncbi:hypothetical protein [Bacillus sp. B15-48]|uniref:hypothetical protein n=1 Tax=Bacillus sp. B15-48 TaxID=1548601 RepID=UPI00193F8325|nr:hypothetical protein [Bacillus sp. B15-48]MBM4761345.1 hypothetical protein [Bacillus sp. B15-48]